jgi:chemotaxis protein MotA
MRAPSPLDLFSADTGRSAGSGRAADTGHLQARQRPDITTVAGFALGFLLLAAAIALGGSAASFFDVPSLLIVVGGTLSAVAVCFSFRDVAEAAQAVRRAVGRAPITPRVMAARLLAIADYTRQAGILALEDLPRAAVGTPFLAKALALVVDGADEAEIAATMRRDLLAGSSGHRHSIEVLRKAAEIAPAMGLIGTLVGLVQMLRHLDQPAAIGPGMAVALLTTFYGAVLGHMVFAPLAAKLERQATAEALVDELCILAAVSIGRQENPRRLEAALNGVLPPAERIRVFD